MTDRQTREATIRVAKAERSRTNRMTDRQTREVNIRVAKAERSRTNTFMIMNILRLKKAQVSQCEFIVYKMYKSISDRKVQV